MKCLASHFFKNHGGRCIPWWWNGFTVFQNGQIIGLHEEKKTMSEEKKLIIFIREPPQSLDFNHSESFWEVLEKTAKLFNHLVMKTRSQVKNQGI